MSDLNSINRLIASVWSELTATGVIGSGASGTVYKTVSRGNVSALKVIRVPLNPNEIPAVGQNELLRERANAQYAVTVDALCKAVGLQQSLGGEPNIQTVYEYSVVPCEDGIGSYVLIRSECLNSVEQLGEFSPLQAIQLAIDVCAALEVCERNHIRHGNIKPGNIFVNELGVYKLGDIGISGVLGTGLAGAGGFLAPEVYGGGAGDIRSDIFSVGAIVYFLLGDRRLPFYISHGQPLAASRAMTPELNQLLATACADKPADRYPTATSMKQELINLYTSMVFGEGDGQNGAQTDAGVAFVPAEGAGQPQEPEPVSDGAGVADGAVLQSVFAPDSSGVATVSTGEITPPVDNDSTVSVQDNAFTAETKLFSNEKLNDEPYPGTVTEIYIPVSGNTTQDIPVIPKKAKKPKKSPDVNTKKGRRAAYGEEDKKHGSVPVIILSIVVIVAVLAALGFGVYWVVETVRSLSFEGYSPDDENAPDPVEIEITELPEKLEYYSGETVDPTGLVIEAKYDDFRSASVTEGFTLDKQVFYDEGTHVVTVTYGNCTDSFEITVVSADLVDLQISHKPDKLSYVYNQDIDFTGLELAAYYSDGAVLMIDEGYEVSSKVAEEVGTQVITVTYGLRTVNFSISVNEKSVESISIKSLPDKLEYAVGQAVDIEGLLLNVVYSNGISAAVSADITVSPEVLDTVGKQTVFVRYGGAETAFEVNVVEAAVTGITVSTMPAKLDYYEGEVLSLDGIVISEEYSNGTVKEVTDGYTYLPTTAQTVGAQVVTVYYGEHSATFNVVVKAGSAPIDPSTIASVSIASNPKQLSYNVGDTLVTNGLALNVRYTNGTTARITSGFTVTPTWLTNAGRQYITVAYGGRYTGFYVNVTEKAVASVSVKSNPAKLTYNVGDTIYTSGLKLTVKYSDGTSREVTGGFTYSPTEVKSAGKQYITVTYGGKSTGFYVTVNEKKVTSVSVKTNPAKLTYNVGDTIYSSGLKLTVKYSDGSTKDITGGFTYSPTVVNSAGKQYITVTYGGKSTGFYVTVNDASPNSLKVKTMPAKTEYYTGDKLDTSGLTLTLGYPNGKTETVKSGFAVSVSTLDKVGTQKVTVTYSGLSASFNVTVKQRQISDSGKLTSTLSWSVENGTLTISGTGQMSDFIYLGAPWQKYADSIKTVTVQSGVLTVASNAFIDLACETINIPETVTLIDDDAIYLCGSLRNVFVATANRAYASQSGCLYSKDLTKLLVYPTGRTETTVTLPTSTKVIDGYRIFAGSNITELIIPESVYSVDETAFYGADKLEKITVRSRNSALCSLNGVLYNKSMTELMCYPAAKTGGTAVIPDTVKFIRAYAFANNRNVDQISIPSSLQEIGNYAFTGMDSLDSVIYLGSEDKWDDIYINNGNNPLTDADISYNG